MTDDQLRVSRKIVGALSRRYAGRYAPVQYEDLVLEAWEHAVLASRDFNGKGSFRGYAYWRIRNGLISYLRRSGTRYAPYPKFQQVGTWTDESDPDAPASVQLTPHKVDKHELDMERLLNMLPERERHVIRGQFVEGKTGGELAAELGLSRSRVSQLSYGALAILRRRIHANGLR